MLIRLMIALVASAALVGCGGKAKQSAKREQDRTILQVEDLTNQRNTLKSELERMKQEYAALLATQEATQKDLDSTRRSLAESRLDTQAAAKLLDQSKAQMSSLQQRVSELERRVQSHASPPAGGETRELSTPTTSPAK